MKEILVKLGFYCFALILAAITASKTHIEDDFFILAGLGIVIVQNVFIRWALAAQQEKVDKAQQETMRAGTEL